MSERPTASGGRAGVAFVGYLGASVLLFGVPALRHLGTSFIGEGSGDAKLYVWDLGWWPHAIVAGLNPFHAGVVWAPSGANMAWITGLPGPALLMFPVTRLFGGVVASNLLAMLAPALGAWAAFLLCHEITASLWPSVASGYLFGFSTYEVAQMHGHVNLFLTFPVPLAVYLVVRFANGRLSRRRFEWLLALVLVAEFSISTEVFATMTFFGAIALAGGLAFEPALRARSRELLVPLGLAYVLAAVPLAPYLWYASSGVPPALAGGVSGASVDLLSFIVPRSATLIGGSTFASLTGAFRSNASEDGAYLGAVLLAALAVALVTGWRDRVTRLLFAFMGVTALFALGGRLEIRGRRTIPLPWRLFEHVPVLKDALPERFTLYLWLGVAVVVARWLSERPASAAWGAAIPWAAVGVAAVMLLPNVSLPNLHRRIELPPFIATGAFHRYLSPGETVFIVHAIEDQGDEMLWQERSGFSFRMPQGHTGPEPAPFAHDPVWQQMKNGEPYGVTAAELRGWLSTHGVGAVIVTADVARRWRSLLTAATGSVPHPVGGVVLYAMRLSTVGT